MAAPPFGTALPTAAALSNGKVVFAGGGTSGGTPISSSVLYDPATDVWSGVATTTGDGRVAAGAVTLPGGKVFVAGGIGLSGALNTAELYDPTTNTWAAVPTPMQSAHGNNPVVQLLRTGQVLIAGGTDSGGPTNAVDLYDPVHNTFVTPAPTPMGTPRAQPAFALLPSGKVLVAGGSGPSNTPLSSAEVYDPAGGTWSGTSNSLSTPRARGAAAVTLGNGKVLVIGGLNHISATTTTASTDLYDPATKAFTPAAVMHTSRRNFAVGTLPDGRVLVAGGEVDDPAAKTVVPDAELYDPTADAWRVTDPLPNAVTAAASVVLPSGQVLVIDGGTDANSEARLLTAALYTPATRPSAPLAVSASAGPRSALVTFAPPVSTGGSPIQSYTVTPSGGPSVTTSDARTTVTITGLAPGRPVSFTVVANNALGAGAPSTQSNQVTPLPSSQPTDRAPKLTISRLKTKLRLTAFLKGITFAVAPDKPASLQISLVGSVNRATIAKAYNLTLASSRLASSGRKRTVTLRPNKALVGRPRAATIQLVLVASDAAGSRSTTTRTIHVSR